MRQKQLHCLCIDRAATVEEERRPHHHKKRHGEEKEKKSKRDRSGRESKLLVSVPAAPAIATSRHVCCPLQLTPCSGNGAAQTRQLTGCAVTSDDDLPASVCAIKLTAAPLSRRVGNIEVLNESAMFSLQAMRCVKRGSVGAAAAAAHP